MGELVVKRAWESQPQEAVPIDSRWIDAGLSSAIARAGGGNGPLRDLRWENAAPDVDTTTAAAAAAGFVADISGSQYARFPDRPEYRTTGAVTIICGQVVRSYSNYTHMVSKNGTTAGDNSPYEFRHASTTGNELTVVRAGAPNFSIWTSTGATSSTGYQVNAFSMTNGDLTGLPRMWQNGKELTVSVTSGNTGTVTDNGQPLYVGKRQDSVTQLDGQIVFIWIFNRALTPGEIVELSNNPWALFQPRTFILTLPSASGSYTLTVGQGSYALTGQNAGLLAALQLTATQGSYSQTGQDANLTVGRSMQVAQGSYSNTGQDANLLLGRSLVADQGTYANTGNAAGLTVSRMLAAALGSYTLTGSDAALLFNRLLTATQGSYALAGQDANLIYTPAGAYVLTAGSGSYTLVGLDAILTTARLLSAGFGTYAHAGQAAGLARGLTMAADFGSYTHVGNDTGFARAYVLGADYGQYTLQGDPVTLSYSGVALPQPLASIPASRRIRIGSPSLRPAQRSTSRRR